MLCALCSVLCTLCFVSVSAPLCAPLCSTLCAVCCVLCAVCCVLCAVCCVLCAVCCVLCALLNDILITSLPCRNDSEIKSIDDASSHDLRDSSRMLRIWIYPKVEKGLIVGQQSEAEHGRSHHRRDREIRASCLPRARAFQATAYHRNNALRSS